METYASGSLTGCARRFRADAAKEFFPEDICHIKKSLTFGRMVWEWAADHRSQRGIGVASRELASGGTKLVLTRAGRSPRALARILTETCKVSAEVSPLT